MWEKGLNGFGGIAELIKPVSDRSDCCRDYRKWIKIMCYIINFSHLLNIGLVEHKQKNIPI